MKAVYLRGHDKNVCIKIALFSHETKSWSLIKNNPEKNGGKIGYNKFIRPRLFLRLFLDK